jgi:hypothetical protein
MLTRRPESWEEPWLFVGKNQAHFGKVVDVMFTARDSKLLLLSIGEDRMLVEYDVDSSGFFEGLCT